MPIWVFQETDAKTKSEVQGIYLGKYLLKIKGKGSRNVSGKPSDHNVGLTAMKRERKVWVGQASDRNTVLRKS